MAIRRILAVAALMQLAADPGLGNPTGLDAYSGYWSGLGTVVMATGSTEQVKCVATYRTGGEQLKQNLRCASASYSINGAAEVTVRAGQVKGTWEEKTYSAVGTINGKATAEGMALAIDSPNFGASMTLTLAGCKQSISIQPKGLDVSKISISLAKC